MIDEPDVKLLVDLDHVADIAASMPKNSNYWKFPREGILNPEKNYY